MKKTIAALLLSIYGSAFAQNVEHMEPPFWWAGMKEKGLQLMVHGKGIGRTDPVISYPGVTVRSVTRVPNKNYLFIDLDIDAHAKPGKFDIRFDGPGKPVTYTYRLLEREPGSAQRRGFDSTDAIYQIMPDRWANGSAANDSVKGMPDTVKRHEGYGRHGGDLQGITANLDYIAKLGFTQLWPTPVVENDMPAYSYHGYAATDHYKIDPRFGSNEDYVKLSRAAKQRGIGLIQDVVLSHIGSSHWWLKDLPTPDWLSFNARFIPTEHHRVSVQDPYGSKADKENFVDGWFGEGMPDMNQKNPLVANYLIQNNIWWIEYAGLSGLRIDTYGYSDGAFLTEYGRRIMAEYPRLNMVGEEWHKSPNVVSRWQAGKQNFDGYRSHTPSMMDFPMAEAMRNALAAPPGWRAFTDVYETLSQDYVYPNPGNLVLFEGNHDISRLYSVVGEDYGLWQIGIAYIMTMPRIPQMYYGTEILMTSTTGQRDDASYRHDFPGGWAGDKVNAFTGAGLSERQKSAQEYVRKLANWRRTQPVIHHGKMMHFGAEGQTYVYFRYDDKKKVLVALNKGDKPAMLPVARFSEMLAGVARGTDVVTGKVHDLSSTLTLAPRSPLILELETNKQ